MRHAAALLALLCLGVLAAPARAEDSAPDSSLHHFLHNLSDSTDRFFGVTTSPVDTAGLDSALVAGLAKPFREPQWITRLGFGPVFAFNRVDGTVLGASAGLANRAGRWRLGLDLSHAVGSDRWLGGGEATLGFRRGDAFWSLRLAGSRRTAVMDRDHEERLLSTLRALVWGSDRQHYLNRTGASLALARQAPGWRIEARYRESREAPLAVTTRWNLVHDALDEPTNLAASKGLVHEAGLDARLRLPLLPLKTQLTWLVSDGALGSDFDYRRARIAISGDHTIAGRFSVLPQFVYGRLMGDQMPQAAFYLGGRHTLRSLPDEALGGAAMALARLDLMGADDLLSLAHIPHPVFIAIQGGLFAATGAAWGADPFGGPATPGVAWPDRSGWRSELGGSLLYRPGVPDDEAYFRLDYAHPVGNHDGPARWTFSYTRALDLMRSP